MAEELVIKTEQPQKKKNVVGEMVENVGFGTVIIFILIIFAMVYTMKYFQGQKLGQLLSVVILASIIFYIYNEKTQVSYRIPTAEEAKAVAEEKLRMAEARGDFIIGGVCLKECTRSPLYLEGDLKTINGIPKYYLFGFDIDIWHCAAKVYVEKHNYLNVTFMRYVQGIDGTEVPEVIYKDSMALKNFKENPNFYKFAGGVK